MGMKIEMGIVPKSFLSLMVFRKYVKTARERERGRREDKKEIRPLLDYSVVKGKPALLSMFSFQCLYLSRPN